LTSPDPQRGSSSPRDLPGLAAFLTLGTTIAGTVGVFVGLGLWGDAVFKTSPLCLVLGLVLGCVAAAVATAALVRRYL